MHRDTATERRGYSACRAVLIECTTVIVVGAGINGVTAAIELKWRGHTVILVDPGPLPHPLAASTDISKAVRAAYGADEEYTEMAERSIKGWRKWNEEFGFELYHEVGFLFLRRGMMQPGDFEFESFNLLTRRGHKIERIDPGRLRERFPAWNSELYQDGFVNVEAGYVESGRVVAMLVQRAKSIGVELREGNKFIELDESGGRVRGIVLQDRQRIDGDVVVMAVGAWTPYLLPFTKPFFRATGHAVFHLKPPNPELFAPERFPGFRRRHFDDRLLRFSAKSRRRGKDRQSWAGPRDVARFCANEM